MPSESDQTDLPPTGTRAALLDAGLHLFGQKGFAATSTRELADRAGANVGSIAYHFGGKDGLHIACGAEVARRVAAVVGNPGTPLPDSPAAARQRLEALVRAMLGFLTGSHQADDIVAFILHELSTSGPGLEPLYDKLIGPKHRELCAVWAMASGEDAESDAVKLRVFSILGQVLYFRLGREIVTRRMDWPADGPMPVAPVADVLVENLHRLLDQGARS